MQYLTTKSISIIAGVILTIIFIFMVIFSLTAGTPTGVVPETPPTTINLNKVVPLNIKQAPTVPPDQGGGIDENSPLVQISISEIQKIYQQLPYSNNFVSSSGVEVSILIPRQEFQTNRWALTAQVFGINYNTSPDQPDYESMRGSFKEAAGQIFVWTQQNGVDPNKIIFIWGDKKYIQDQAVKWLNE